MSNKKYYAKVVWTIDDIQSLRPEWSDEQCEEWLSDNQKHIQSRLVELGWEVIEILLDS
jgi:hypothetical protein